MAESRPSLDRSCESVAGPAVSEFPSLLAKPLAVLREAEQQAEDCLKVIKGLCEHLAKVAKSVQSRPKPLAQLAKLAEELRTYPFPTVAVDVGSWARLLQEQLRPLQENYEQVFVEELARCCEQASISFKPVPDGMNVGPCLVIPQYAKETVKIIYAKVEVESGLRLDPPTLLERIRHFQKTILQPPSDVSGLRKRIEEAMRCCPSTTAADGLLRAELPAVYRCLAEQQDLGLEQERAGKSGCGLSRFIVGLKAVIQSDENLNSPRRLRLEAAVLENTANARKSIFIPDELSEGWGSGAYYQAMVLLE